MSNRGSASQDECQKAVISTSSCLDCQRLMQKVEGRVSTLYQIKEDELFLEWMQVMCTQVAKLNANIPYNSLSTNPEVST